MTATDADGTAWAVTFDDTRGFGLVHRLAFARILADSASLLSLARRPPNTARRVALMAHR